MMSTIHLLNEETGARAASSLKQTVPGMDQDGAEGSSQKLEADPEPPLQRCEPACRTSGRLFVNCQRRN